MKIKKITYTSGEINAVTVTVKDAYMDIVASGTGTNGTVVETIRKYPQVVSLVNKSGADIEIALLANQTEVDDFAINPNDYFFLVPNNTSLNSQNRVGRVYKVAVRKESTNVSSGIRIDFLSFVGTVRV